MENQDSGELKKPSSSNSTTKTQTQTYFYFYVIENNPTVHGRVYGLWMIEVRNIITKKHKTSKFSHEIDKKKNVKMP